jgi:hypothetical protein
MDCEAEKKQAEKRTAENARGSHFDMEYRLKALNPELHRCFTETVSVLPYTLSRYRQHFPEYTDHSVLHSLTVIDYCNQLIGDQIERLNADELYILLMGCYLHDSGMGISEEQFQEFSGQIDFGDYFDTHPDRNVQTVIRDFHQEFSAAFIRKYARLWQIPSDVHLQAVIQVARGHRRTDLTDETEYPAEFPLPGGNTACLPYLAAVIRLADEIDVTESRHPALLFDIDSVADQAQAVLHRMLLAVKSMEITPSAFVLHIDTADRQVLEQLRRMAEKIQRMLDYCRETVRQRTPYVISQESVRMIFKTEESDGSGVQG